MPHAAKLQSSLRWHRQTARLWASEHADARIYVCAHRDRRTRVYRIHAHTHTRTHTHTYTHTHSHPHVHTYTNTHTQKHTHTQTHILTLTLASKGARRGVLLQRCCFVLCEQRALNVRGGHAERMRMECHSVRAVGGYARRCSPVKSAPVRHCCACTLCACAPRLRATNWQWGPSVRFHQQQQCKMRITSQ